MKVVLVEQIFKKKCLPTGVTLFSTPSAVPSGDSLSKMLESMGSPLTRIVIESGEEEEGESSRGNPIIESGGEVEGESSSGAVEELPSESPKSLICAVCLLERGT